MPDVYFSGWFRVIYFMIRRKRFSFAFIKKLLDFFVILDIAILCNTL